MKEFNKILRAPLLRNSLRELHLYGAAAGVFFSEELVALLRPLVVCCWFLVGGGGYLLDIECNLVLLRVQ